MRQSDSHVLRGEENRGGISARKRHKGSEREKILPVLKNFRRSPEKNVDRKQT